MECLFHSVTMAFMHVVISTSAAIYSVAAPDSTSELLGCIEEKELTGKRKSWLHTNELLTVRQDISQGRQQSANPKQSAKCNRRSSKYSLVFFFSVAVHPILLHPNPTLTWNALQKQQNSSTLENGMLCSSSLYSVVFQHRITSWTHIFFAAALLRHRSPQEDV